MFGPRRLPDFDVHLGGVSLPVVSSYKYLGVLLTPTLSWTKHVQLLISRGNRLFTQCVAWCRVEHLPVHMASSIFRVYVLPSVSWGSEFFAHSPAALDLLDGAIRRWGRHILGWPSGSPCAGVLCELGWPDAEHLAMGRLFSLLGRSFSMAQGLGVHSPPLSFLSVASQSPGTWAHHALAMCAHLDIPSPLAAGIHPQSPPPRVRRWVDLVVSPSLNLALHQRLQASIHSLSTTRLPDGATFSVNILISSCMAEEFLRSMRGSGASPVGVMTPSLVDALQDILVFLKVADSVMPLWGISGTPCPVVQKMPNLTAICAGMEPPFLDL